MKRPSRHSSINFMGLELKIALNRLCAHILQCGMKGCIAFLMPYVSKGVSSLNLGRVLTRPFFFGTTADGVAKRPLTKRRRQL